jgi:hypothetical protein
MKPEMVQASERGLDPEALTVAVERGKEWLLRNQITPETKRYDQFGLPAENGTKAEWHEIPTPSRLVGAFYSNLARNDPHATRPNEVRRQYYNTWHTAQAGVALLDYLDYRDDAAVRHSVDLAWDFIERHQVLEGEWRGVFVEMPPGELEYPLVNAHSFGHTSRKARNGYADYDNIETDLFPLELYRRQGRAEALEAARLNADFYIEKHPEIVFFEIETGAYAMSGMSNDAIYGRLFEHTGDPKSRDAFRKQLQRLSSLGLDLRASKNIRNMYWDATACAYAVERFPEMRGPAMAKLALLGEHLLAAQKDSGVLWFRYRAPGVPDQTPGCRTQDGAATHAAMRMWGALYDQTGDIRWLRAIRQAAFFALTQQYSDDHGPEFAGAFEYAGVVMDPGTGKSYECLRDISTIFALRALIPLLRPATRWAEDFWRQGR